MAKVNKKEKVCEFCGLPFVPNSNFQRYCKRPHYMNCPVCGKQYLVTNNENLKRPPVACSYACRVKRTQATSLKKYGIVAPGNNAEARKKARKTMIDRYGVEYTLQSAELKERVSTTVQQKYGTSNVQQNSDIRDKTARTNMQRYGSSTYLTSEQGKANYREKMMSRYGVQYPLQSKQILDKCKETNLQRYNSPCVLSSEYVIERTKLAAQQQYGVEHFSKAPEIQQKIAQTCLERYGVSNASKSKATIDKIKATTMERYGVPFYVMSPDVQRHFSQVSKLNRTIADKLAEYNIHSEYEYIINHSRYDLYLPSHNLLIEINPTYTHNAIGNHWTSEGLPMNYHIDKCRKAIDKEMNIRCIFDWDSTNDMIKELASPYIIINSENLDVYKLTRTAYKTFLNAYGHRRNKKYNRKEVAFGLVKDGLLYQVILLQKSMYHHHSTVIADYGTRWGYNIENGLNKLLQTIFNIYEKNDIILELPFDRLDINDLHEMNLHYYHSVHPMLIWSKKNECITDNKNIDKESMLADGWLPVYDCGQAVYTF